MPHKPLIRRLPLVAVLLVQFVCALFFVSDILLSVLGIYIAPLSWESREMLEIGAALGLVLGVVLGAVLLWRSLHSAQAAREQLRRAAGAFGEVLEERFSQWRLTAAERDVALFALKGMSTAEIARLRNTSEGTVKAQTGAIYRKAGVTGRGQLLSLFIEDLMDGIAAPLPEGVAPGRASEAGFSPRGES